MPETVNYTCEVCGTSLNDADLENNATNGDGTLRRYVIQGSCWRGFNGNPPVQAKSLKEYFFCCIPHMQTFTTVFTDPFATP